MDFDASFLKVTQMKDRTLALFILTSEGMAGLGLAGADPGRFAI